MSAVAADRQATNEGERESGVDFDCQYLPYCISANGKGKRRE